MRKIILTINEKDYPVESFNYSIHKSAGMEVDTVNGIGVNLGIVKTNSGLESVMVSGPFSCTITVFDVSGAVLRQIILDDAEITSYSLNMTEETSYSNIYIGANLAQIEGRDISVEDNW